jgi:hypothetical protein
MARRMVTMSCDSVVLLRQGTSNPSDDEWDECMAILSSKNLDIVKVFVMTEGGSPTPRQQRRLAQVLSGKAIPVAVASESAMVRFVVSSVALITKRIRSFHANDLAGAFAHLQLNPAEREFVQVALDESKRLLSGNAFGSNSSGATS